MKALGGTWSPSEWQTGLASGFCLYLPALLVGFGTSGFVTRRFAPRSFDRETHCRKCGYILRGISEPRWPEREERI